ncbi:hypothetical protein C8R43DRAFT_840647, partial [Mycena crocata]
MSSNSAGVPSVLPDGEKFEGTGFKGWELKFVALAKARGLGGYIDGTIPCPPAPAAGDTPHTTVLPPEPTSLYSSTPSHEEWKHRDAMATALIVLNIKNPIGLGLKSDGTAAAAMQSL